MASGDTLAIFKPFEGEPPLSAFATLDARNATPTVDFDGATDEEYVWTFVMPSNYTNRGVTVKLHIRFTSATSGNSRWQTSFENDVAQDIDSDGFATANSGGGVPNGTSGVETIVSINHANGSEIDSIVAGNLGRFKLRRDADGTSGTDDVTTDAELVAIEIVEQ